MGKLLNEDPLHGQQKSASRLDKLSKSPEATQLTDWKNCFINRAFCEDDPLFTFFAIFVR